MPKGYWIPHLDVSNPEGFQAYREMADAGHKRFGSKLLARGGRRHELGQPRHGLRGPAPVVGLFPHLPDHLARQVQHRDVQEVDPDLAAEDEPGTPVEAEQPRASSDPSGADPDLFDQVFAEELVDQGRDRGLVQAGGPGDVGPREGRLLAQQVEDDGPVDGLDQRLVTGAEDQCPSSCGSVCGSVGSGSVRGPV